MLNVSWELTLVSISLRGPKLTIAFLHSSRKLAFVQDMSSFEYEDAFSPRYILLECSLVCVAILPCVHSNPLFYALIPHSVVFISIGISVSAMRWELIVLKCAYIDISSLSSKYSLFFHPIFHKCPLIDITIHKCVFSSAIEFILLNLTFILISIGVGECSYTLNITRLKISQILITIGEDVCSSTVAAVLLHLTNVFCSIVVDNGLDAWLGWLFRVWKEPFAASDWSEGFPKKGKHYNIAMNIDNLQSDLFDDDNAFVKRDIHGVLLVLLLHGFLHLISLRRWHHSLQVWLPVDCSNWTHKFLVACCRCYWSVMLSPLSVLLQWNLRIRSYLLNCLWFYGKILWWWCHDSIRLSGWLVSRRSECIVLVAPTIVVSIVRDILHLQVNWWYFWLNISGSILLHYLLWHHRSCCSCRYLDTGRRRQLLT